MSLSYSEYQPALDTSKKRIPSIGKPNLQDEEDKEKRLERVNQLIMQNTMEQPPSDEKMSDFISPPQISKLPHTETKPEFPRYDPDIIPKQSNHYASSPIPTVDNDYSNYRYAYNHPPAISQYITSNPNNPNTKDAMKHLGDRREMDKIWEKLNYMTLLLEEQRAEKTNYITEEFVLYIFLGVFIIYVVDGFAKSSNKYVR